jgi:hypothetical protein
MWHILNETVEDRVMIETEIAHSLIHWTIINLSSADVRSFRLQTMDVSLIMNV